MIADYSMKPSSTKAAVREAVKIVGSIAELARRSGLSRATIHNALNGKKIDADTALAIEGGTNGKVGREALRPDLYS